jgi:3-hydroxymyristoyl/3-hydroxydecanoyl-(acyl carrier protein) dehydratase
MRWDLIDKFEILKKGSHSRARKAFSGREDFFQEHFSGRPLVPEPLFIEMVAQSGGVLFGLALDFKKEVILAKISDARFFAEVAPPCELVVEARVEGEREEGAWIWGRVDLDGRAVAEVRLLLVSMEKLGARRDSVVFNEGFLEHYDVHNIAKASEAAI